MSGGSVKVYTEAVCAICDTVRRTEGAEGDTPPIGWADLKLAIRLTGSGWTNREVMSWFLCEKCRILVTSYINEMQRTRAGEGRKK